MNPRSTDKMTNFYKMKVETAEALVEKEIHKEYKRAEPDIVEKWNEEGKSIAIKLEFDDIVFATYKQEAFQTLKVHKENFMNNPTSRLITPAKPELGRVSKKYLSEIVEIVKRESGLTQWRNTYNLLVWLNSLPDKQK